MAVISYRPAEIQSTDPDRHRRHIAETANLVLDGKVNSAIDFELETTGTTTTVTNDKISISSRVILTPTDQLTASELASGGIYVDEDDIDNGQFVVTHTQSASTRVFRAVVFG